MEALNEFFGFVFEERGHYLSRSKPSGEPGPCKYSSSPPMRSRMVLSFTYNDDVIVPDGGTVMCVQGSSPSSPCRVCVEFQDLVIGLPVPQHRCRSPEGSSRVCCDRFSRHFFLESKTVKEVRGYSPAQTQGAF